MFASKFLECVSGSSTGLCQELTAMQQAAFPPGMQFKNAEEYYRDALDGAENFNLILRGENGQVTGYVLGIPHYLACQDLCSWDPAMRSSPGNLYLEMIQTLPGRRQITGVKTLMSGICRVARAHGFDRLSAHVRTTTGLSSLIQRVLVDCHCLRRIDNWYGSGETFDYLEACATWKTRGD